MQDGLTSLKKPEAGVYRSGAELLRTGRCGHRSLVVPSRVRANSKALNTHIASF